MAMLRASPLPTDSADASASSEARLRRDGSIRCARDSSVLSTGTIDDVETAPEIALSRTERRAAGEAAAAPPMRSAATFESIPCSWLAWISMRARSAQPDSAAVRSVTHPSVTERLMVLPPLQGTESLAPERMYTHRRLGE